jgi:hypothetical protein
MSRNSVVDIIIKFADVNSPILVSISLPLQGFQQMICEEAMFELSAFEARDSSQVLPYHSRAEYFTPWLDHCDESFHVPCTM